MDRTPKLEIWTGPPPPKREKPTPELFQGIVAAWVTSKTPDGEIEIRSLPVDSVSDKKEVAMSVQLIDEHKARSDRIAELLSNESDDLTIDDVEWFIEFVGTEDELIMAGRYLIRRIRDLERRYEYGP